ncbi:hypothetical protein [Limnoglobus roseus]|uniref:Uncharacterized protein n=1 Tax=Limnoglobus roseus TaxID=2598579 RepID=A0A5C1AT47_9BACT|nr:hypothetical protein [Limnoglobus roseus]QEL20374.1 hypothetical protein PX52LOC_07467 [Limnoglobus roseus]
MNAPTATVAIPPQAPPTRWPFAIAFALFGLGLAAAVAVSLTEQNLNLYRARFTIWLVMLLVTPAFCRYALGRRTDAQWRRWRWFWTFAGLAYFVHLYYGLRAFHFSLNDVYAKQGSLTATSNLIVSALWALDLVQIWLLGRNLPRWGRVLQFAAVVLVFISAFTATVIFKTGYIHNAGLVMTVIVAGCVVYGLLDCYSSRQPGKP